MLDFVSENKDSPFFLYYPTVTREPYRNRGRITDLYVGLRYAPSPPSGGIASLRRAVHDFRPSAP